MEKKKSSSTQYSIDLDLKGLILFGVLALLTAVVVFYLGVIFGKASRDPNTFVQKKPAPTNSAVISEDLISNKDLEIFKMRNDDKVKNLKNDTKDLLAEADRMIMETKQQIKTDTEAQKSKPPKVKKTAAVAATESQKKWPEDSAVKKKTQDVYTVQVFATKDKDKADRIVRLLRKQQFDAYLVSATIENQLIYRVRIGRKSKTEITKLNQDLKSVIGGMGMKSRIIKIN